MSFSRKIKKIVQNTVYNRLPFFHLLLQRGVTNPTFIVGSPRSGTSIFYRILNRAPDVLCLNEPRHIWVNRYPNLDVWAYKYPISQGKLYWDSSDVKRGDAAYFAKWLRLELLLHRKHRLVAKTPENCFRWKWLHAMLPEAKFIHLLRHGRDVALSLTQVLRSWFPDGYWESSRHYGIFRDYARKSPALCDKLGYITEDSGNYPRSLLVWACYVAEAQHLFRALKPDQYLEIRYENLVEKPHAELKRVFNFLEEPLSKESAAYAVDVLRSDSIGKPDPHPQLTRNMIGELLANKGYCI